MHFLPKEILTIYGIVVKKRNSQVIYSRISTITSVASTTTKLQLSTCVMALVQGIS